MQKFWTVKNGVIGTAHLNRNGEEVDFRSRSREVKYCPQRSGVVITPGEGVQADDLILKNYRFREVVGPANDQQRAMVTYHCSADFKGVEVWATVRHLARLITLEIGDCLWPSEKQRKLEFYQELKSLIDAEDGAKLLDFLHSSKHGYRRIAGVVRWKDVIKALQQYRHVKLSSIRYESFDIEKVAALVQSEARSRVKLINEEKHIAWQKRKEIA